MAVGMLRDYFKKNGARREVDAVVPEDERLQLELDRVQALQDIVMAYIVMASRPGAARHSYGLYCYGLASRRCKT